ncbi:MAG: tRNA uridine-5-carboxymethylaminomethyl(34) synthesis GTPase MnmE [Kiritimatiellae bacterium]|nr:tRNA uridine-5-carboxymethylaminomethyl(34) synthesis GTPase MnmE [Kiritimatiellia bacterium]
MSLGDTIAAVATAPGRGGVAVVRVSGPEAFQVAERIAGRAPRAGRISFDRYRLDGRLLDDGVTLAFKAPHSYTGEDVVEFQCHGGSVTPRRVLEACLASGARLAHRGEFTERAFLNGKLSYEEAESVLDLVDAKTDRAADAALRGVSGECRKATREIYDALVDISSTAEHALDVSEEELPSGFLDGLVSSVAAISARLDEAIRRAKEGKILREGALVVIAGPPNAGKSSLLNALLGESRAIVSATPGTTRDSIEEWLDIDGWPVRLVDTAGLRETGDAIEGEGVARARGLMGKADIVLNLTPADGDQAGGTSGAGGTCGAVIVIEVFSKCDLIPSPFPVPRSPFPVPHSPFPVPHSPFPVPHSPFPVPRSPFPVPRSPFPVPRSPFPVSAKTGEGLEALRGAIAAELERKAAEPGDADSALGRDAAALVEARTLLSSTPPLSNSPTPPPPDLVLLANCVRAAAEKLGGAIGATYSADMLDALFSRFCVGK